MAILEVETAKILFDDINRLGRLTFTSGNKIIKENNNEFRIYNGDCWEMTFKTPLEALIEVYNMGDLLNDQILEALTTASTVEVSKEEVEVKLDYLNDTTGKVLTFKTTNDVEESKFQIRKTIGCFIVREFEDGKYKDWNPFRYEEMVTFFFGFGVKIYQIGYGEETPTPTPTPTEESTLTTIKSDFKPGDAVVLKWEDKENERGEIEIFRGTKVVTTALYTLPLNDVLNSKKVELELI